MGDEGEGSCKRRAARQGARAPRLRSKERTEERQEKKGNREATPDTSHRLSALVTNLS